MEACGNDIQGFKTIVDNMKCKNYFVIKTELRQILANVSTVVLPSEFWPVVEELLKVSDNEITQFILQIVFECSKNMVNQPVLTNEAIINCMLNLLKSMPDRSVPIQLSAIGTLANMCYENEKAASMMGTDGILFALEMLAKNKENVVPSGLLISTNYIGLLLNILNGNTAFYKFAIDNGMLPLLEHIMKTNLSDIANNYFLYKCLIVIIDGILTYCSELVDKTFFELIVDILLSSPPQDLTNYCLEILTEHMGRADVRTTLATKGVCKFIVTWINECKSQSEHETTKDALIKRACDTLVIVLTDDQCMEILFHKGTGELVNYFSMWLGEEDPDLLCTAILALGNFARNDANCLLLAEKGVINNLVGILRKHNGPTADPKIQHALLSTLKNLAIPPLNKVKMVERGIIDAAKPFLKTPHVFIFFRLIGLFRFLIDKQTSTADKLLSETNILQAFAECKHKDENGVQTEVSRFLAWTLKVLHLPHVVEDIIKSNGIRYLLDLMNADRSIMQTESLTAVHTIANNLEYEKPNGISVNNWPLFANKLIECNYGTCIVTCCNLYEGTNADSFKFLYDTLFLLLKNVPLLIGPHFKDTNVIDALATANVTHFDQKYNATIGILKNIVC